VGNNIRDYFIGLSSQQYAQFDKLESIYRHWNNLINVISRKDIDHFFIHHVLHSLSIARLIQFKEQSRILDLGTGGGFPGIPLAIFFPQVKFHLVDSIGKKIKVVNEVAQELGLSNVRAEQIRAEKLNGKYDFIVSRAVAQWDDLYKWSAERISIRDSKHALLNGWLLLKGGDLAQEFQPVSKHKVEHSISLWFDDPFFETKKLIYIPAE
jgi:16S rRNA (guanine527-N7)-methyltransferase